MLTYRIFEAAMPYKKLMHRSYYRGDGECCPEVGLLNDLVDARLGRQVLGGQGQGRGHTVPDVAVGGLDRNSD